MTRLVCWLLVVVLVGLGVAALSVVLRQRREAGLDMPLYSVWSDGEEGLGPLAHLLHDLKPHWTPVSVTRPIQGMPYRGLLIVTLASRVEMGRRVEDELSEADTHGLLHWVAQGNTILFAADMNTRLHQALGMTRIDHPGSEDVYVRSHPLPAGGYTAGVDLLDVRPRATLQVGADAMPLWNVDGRVGAAVVRHGKGRVVVVADPNMLTRRGLIRQDGEPRDDNAVFLDNVVAMHAEDRTVYFDEYHHGIQSGGGFWAYVAIHGESLTLLLLFAVTSVAIWRVAVRLGPAVSVPRTQQTDAVEYASALGLLYQRAGARRRLSRALVRGFLGGLTRHLRLKARALPAVLLAAWRQQHQTARTAQLETLLRGVNELRRGPVTEQQLLHWTRAFDSFLDSETVGRK
jgi:hypothetical protein